MELDKKWTHICTTVLETFRRLLSCPKSVLNFWCVRHQPRLVKQNNEVLQKPKDDAILDEVNINILERDAIAKN